MIIYPAIDLKGGACVRLAQGDMHKATVYGDPLEMAKRFAQAGSAWLHVVDLDGAFAGEARNLKIIAAIVEQTGLLVQTGGGIRTMAHIGGMLEDVGVQRVILGTAAVEQPGLVRAAVRRYGRRIAVGIDAKGGKVAVKGWAEDTGVDAQKLAQDMKEMGVQTIIYTDIARDGMLSGPDFENTRRLIQQTGLDVIISGGVSDVEQVKTAAALGAGGIIIGRALYQGAIELKEALAIGRESC
ncbi:MAG: 1-(5-phosphoribosyl)-5-[(5-phosphoribosylamino)methylideneamino]imidazole-4-carboxamide isomerase [Eubacteriales bacterium]|nr:1-(5-phosphoribosyl)-5-[(5-phosphoribosylamino)methylideneamino]imidazole-4-carboxamide isomerase [Eubacteriales bacterium]